MKKIILLLLTIFIGAIIYSCNQNNDSQIIGKWRGTHIETSGNSDMSKTQIEAEFDKSGKFMEKNLTSNTFPVTSNFKVEGDTIFWLSNKGELTSLKSHIDFLSESTLSYTTVFGGIEGKTTLEKVKE